MYMNELLYWKKLKFELLDDVIDTLHYLIMLLYICLIAFTLACTDQDRTNCDFVVTHSCHKWCNCSTIPDKGCAGACLGCLAKILGLKYMDICCHCVYPRWPPCNGTKVSSGEGCYYAGQQYSCGAHLGTQMCCEGEWLLCTVHHCENCHCHWFIEKIEILTARWPHYYSTLLVMFVYICLIAFTLACSDSDAEECDDMAAACDSWCNCTTPGYECAAECLSCITMHWGIQYGKICCGCLFPKFKGCNSTKVGPGEGCYVAGQLYSCGAYYGNQRCCDGVWYLCTVHHCENCHCGHWFIGKKLKF